MKNQETSLKGKLRPLLERRKKHFKTKGKLVLLSWKKKRKEKPYNLSFLPGGKNHGLHTVQGGREMNDEEKERKGGGGLESFPFRKRKKEKVIHPPNRPPEKKPNSKCMEKKKRRKGGRGSLLLRGKRRQWG